MLKLTVLGLTEDMSTLSEGDLLAVATESGSHGDWQTPMKRGYAMGIDAARRLAERVYRDRREAAAGSESEQ